MWISLLSCHIVCWDIISTRAGPLSPNLQCVDCVSVLSCFSRVQLFAIPWTVACQSLLTMRFPRQEYWNRKPFPPPWIFSTQGWISLQSKGPGRIKIVAPKSWKNLPNSSTKLIVLLFLSLAALCSRYFMVSYWADPQVLTRAGVPLRKACLCTRNSSGRDWIHIACPQFCKNFSFNECDPDVLTCQTPDTGTGRAWPGERNILPQVCKLLSINHII